MSSTSPPSSPLPFIWILHVSTQAFERKVEPCKHLETVLLTCIHARCNPPQSMLIETRQRPGYSGCPSRGRLALLLVLPLSRPSQRQSKSCMLLVVPFLADFGSRYAIATRCTEGRSCPPITPISPPNARYRVEPSIVWCRLLIAK
jgi:hypothetical protein